jgi:hypothetical protein
MDPVLKKAIISFSVVSVAIAVLAAVATWHTFTSSSTKVVNGVLTTNEISTTLIKSETITAAALSIHTISGQSPVEFEDDIDLKNNSIFNGFSAVIENITTTSLAAPNIASTNIIATGGAPAITLTETGNIVFNQLVTNGFLSVVNGLVSVSPNGPGSGDVVGTNGATVNGITTYLDNTGKAITSNNSLTLTGSGVNNNDSKLETTNGGAFVINSGTGTMTLSGDDTVSIINIATGAASKTVNIGSTAGGSVAVKTLGQGVVHTNAIGTLSSALVGTSDLESKSITSDKLADNSVQSISITDLSITPGKLSVAYLPIVAGGTVSGAVAFSNTSTSTGPTSGAVVVAGGLGVGGNISTQGEIRTKSNVALEHTTGQAVQIAATGGNYTITLPTTAGQADEFLQTDGKGNTVWAPASGGGGGDVSGPTTSTTNSFATYVNELGKEIASNSTLTLTAAGNDSTIATADNGTLALSSGTGTMTLSGDAIATTVNIATGAAAKTINIGSTAGGSVAVKTLGQGVVHTNAIGTLSSALVGTSDLESKSITSAKLADNSVQTININDLSITPGKLSVAYLPLVAGGTVSGAVAFSNTSTSTGPTSGAVVVAGGIGVAGNLNVGGEIRTQSNVLLEHTVGQSVQLAAIGGNYTITLPTTAGLANEFLQTDGSGNTIWAPASGGGGGDVSGPTTSTTNSFATYVNELGKEIASNSTLTLTAAGNDSTIATADNGTLALSSGTGTMTLSGDAIATTVNIATGAAAKTINIGSTVGGSVAVKTLGQGVVHTNAIGTLSSALVGTSDLESKSITSDKLADNSVQSSSITDLSITPGKLSVAYLPLVAGGTVSGAVAFSSTDESTGPTSGAVVVAGGIGVAGNLNVGGEIRTQSNVLLEHTVGQSVQLAAVGGNYTITLPTTAGLADEFLQTNGSGNTIWAPAVLGPATSTTNSFATYVNELGKEIASNSTLTLTADGKNSTIATTANGMLALNSGTGTITLSGDDTDTTVNIATGAAAKTVVIGSTTGGSVAVKTLGQGVVHTDGSGVLSATYVTNADFEDSTISGERLQDESIPNGKTTATSSGTAETIVLRGPDGKFTASQITITGGVTNDTDVATKVYVDGKASGLSVKTPVLLYAPLQVILDGKQVVDGTLVNTGNRVLVANQADLKENGIYVVNGTGPWDRADDMAITSNAQGAYVLVQDGTTLYKSTAWVVSSPTEVKVGTNDIVFVLFSQPSTNFLPLGGGTLTGDLTVPNIHVDGTIVATSIESSGLVAASVDVKGPAQLGSDSSASEIKIGVNEGGSGKAISIGSINTGTKVTLPGLVDVGTGTATTTTNIATGTNGVVKTVNIGNTNANSYIVVPKFTTADAVVTSAADGKLSHGLLVNANVASNADISGSKLEDTSIPTIKLQNVSSTDQTGSDLVVRNSGSFSAKQITLSELPTTNNQVATKGYVDGMACGITVKTPVLLYSGSNITLSGNQSIDGIMTVDSNRVLVNGQTNQIENGIYLANEAAWTPAADMPVGSDPQGSYVVVSSGATKAGFSYITSSEGKVGTDPVVFVEFSQPPTNVVLKSGGPTGGAMTGDLSTTTNITAVGTITATVVAIKNDTKTIELKAPVLADDLKMTLPNTGGAAGEVLSTSGGLNATLAWVPAGGGGNVSNSAGSADNELPIYDETSGTIIKQSKLFVTPSGNNVTMSTASDGTFDLHAGTGTISIGSDATTAELKIGTGGAKNVIIGNTVDASSTVINAGTGNVTINSSNVTINADVDMANRLLTSNELVSNFADIGTNGLIVNEGSTGSVILAGGNTARQVTIGGSAGSTVSIRGSVTLPNSLLTEAGASFHTDRLIVTEVDVTSNVVFLASDTTQVVSANTGAFQCLGGGWFLRSLLVSEQLLCTTANLGSDGLIILSDGSVSVGAGNTVRTVVIGSLVDESKTTVNAGTGNLVLTTSSTGNISINPSETGLINIGTDVKDGAINIGTFGARSIVLGNSGAGTTTSIGINSAGTLISTSAGAMSFTTTGAGAAGLVSINPTGSGPIDIGTGAVAGAIRIGTSGARTITIGSTTTTTSTSISCSTGNLTLATSNGIISINPTGTGAINIGTNVSTGAINIGTFGTRAIAIGSAAASVTVDNITVGSSGLTVETGATGAVILGGGAGSRAVTIGNTVGTSATTINAGSGNIILGANVAMGSNTLTTSGTVSTGALSVTSVNATGEIKSSTATLGTDGLEIATGATGSVILGGGAGSRAVTIGNTVGTSATTINAGSGNIILGANVAMGSNTLTTSGTVSTGALSVTSVNATGEIKSSTATLGTDGLEIATGATGSVTLGGGVGARAVTIGNTIGDSKTTITAGTGNVVVGANVAMGSNTLTTSGTVSTGALTATSVNATGEIKSSTATLGTDGLAIATGATGSVTLGGGTDSRAVTIGNTVGTSATTINAGSGNIILGANVAMGSNTLTTSGTVSTGALSVTSVNATGEIKSSTATLGTDGLEIATGATGSVTLGGGVGARAVTIGNTIGDSKTTITAGTGNVVVGANVAMGSNTLTTSGTVSTGALTATSVNATGEIKSSTATLGTDGLAIATGATGSVTLGGGTDSRAVTIGNTVGTSATTINAGSGNIILGANVAMGSNTLTTSGTVSTGALSVTSVNATGEIKSNTATLGTDGLTIATGESGSVTLGGGVGARAVTIGNTIGDSKTTITAGTGNVVVGANVAMGSNTLTTSGTVSTGALIAASVDVKGQVQLGSDNSTADITIGINEGGSGKAISIGSINTGTKVTLPGLVDVGTGTVATTTNIATGTDSVVKTVNIGNANASSYIVVPKFTTADALVTSAADGKLSHGLLVNANVASDADISGSKLQDTSIPTIKLQNVSSTDQTGNTLVVRNGGSFSAKQITLSDPPTTNDQVATKGYVDGMACGITVKTPVLLYSGSNITLSGNQSIDGIMTVDSNRVLVNGQTNPIENGIYLSNANAWTLASDMPIGSDPQGSYAVVSSGATKAGFSYITSSEGKVGTDPVVFVEFSQPPTNVVLKSGGPTGGAMTGDLSTTTNITAVGTVTAAVVAIKNDAKTIELKAPVLADDLKMTLPNTGGAAGEVLSTSGGLNPTLAWVPQGGGGNVSNSSGSINNELPIYDGTSGTTIKQSKLFVTPSGNNVTMLTASDGTFDLHAGTGTISIGSDATVSELKIGTGGEKKVTVGNTAGASSTVINAGTGNLVLASASTGDISINPTGTGIINIGTDVKDGGINIGTFGARLINIGNAAAPVSFVSLTASSSTASTSSTTGAVRVTGGVGIALVTDATSATNGGALTVAGGVGIGGKLFVAGTVSTGDLTVNGALGLGANTLTTTGTVSTGDLTVNASSTLIVSSTTASSSSTTGAVRVTGGVGIALVTDATSSTNGGALTVAGGVGIGGKLFVTGTVSTGALTVNGAVVLGANTLTTSGAVTTGAMTVNGAISLGSNALTTNGTVSTGTLTVSAVSTLIVLNSVGSTSPSTGAVKVTGGVGIALVTDATSATNGGALTVAGGVGIGGKLFVAGTVSTGALTVNGTVNLGANTLTTSGAVTTGGLTVNGAISLGVNTLTTSGAVTTGAITSTSADIGSSGLTVATGATGAVSLGTGAGPRTVTVGSTGGNSSTTINAGTGNLVLATTTGIISINPTGTTGSINIGTEVKDGGINIGTFGARSIVLGNSGVGATTSIGINSAGTLINTSAGAMSFITTGLLANGRISINPTGTGPIDIGTNNVGGTLSIGTLGARALAIGNSSAVSITARCSGDFDVLVDGGGNLNLDNMGTGGAIAIGSRPRTNPINIGTAGARNITIGNLLNHIHTSINTGSGSLTLRADSGSITINSATGETNIGTANEAGAINIGTSGTRIVTIGSTTGSTTINAGTGNLVLATSSGTISINPTGTGSINIGTVVLDGAINIGTFGIRAVTIGNAAGSINIGANLLMGSRTITTSGSISGGTISASNFTTTGGITSDTALIGSFGLNVDTGLNGTVSLGTGTGSRLVNVGSSIGTSTTNISAGTGGIFVNPTGTGAVNIGSTNLTGGINIGTSGARTITLGNASGTITIASSVSMGTNTLTTTGTVSTGTLVGTSSNASTSSTTGAVRVTGGVGIALVTDATSATNGGALTVAGGVGIGGKLFVTGPVSTGALTVNGAVSLGANTLTTSGTVTTGAMTVNGALGLGANTLTTSGAVTTGGLTVNGAVSLGANTLTTSGAVTTGAMTVNGALGLGANILTTTGTVSTGALTVNGSLSLGSNALSTSGSVLAGTLTVTLNVASTSSVSGAVQVTGGVGIARATDAISSSNGGALTVAGGVGIGGKLFVAGAVSTGALTVSGSVGLGENTLTTTGAVSTGALTVNGSVGLGANTLTTTGTVSTGALTVNGSVGLGANTLTTTGAVSTGALTVNASSALIVSNVAVSSSTTTGAVRVAGGVGIALATDATSATNGGALTVAGGVGIGGKLFVAGTLTIGTSITTLSTTTIFGLDAVGTGTNAVSIGQEANASANFGISIGYRARAPAVGVVTIGSQNAGLNALAGAICIGYAAGSTTVASGVGLGVICIGEGAGSGGSVVGNGAIVIGKNAGNGEGGGTNSINISASTLGSLARLRGILINTSAGTAISNAGAVMLTTNTDNILTQAAANSILINASGAGFSSVTSGCYIAPIRPESAVTNMLHYNTTSNEVMSAPFVSTYVDSFPLTNIVESMNITISFSRVGRCVNVMWQDLTFTVSAVGLVTFNINVLPVRPSQGTNIRILSNLGDSVLRVLANGDCTIYNSNFTNFPTGLRTIYAGQASWISV